MLRPQTSKRRLAVWSSMTSRSRPSGRAPALGRGEHAPLRKDGGSNLGCTNPHCTDTGANGHARRDRSARHHAAVHRTAAALSTVHTECARWREQRHRHSTDARTQHARRLAHSGSGGDHSSGGRADHQWPSQAKNLGDSCTRRRARVRDSPTKRTVETYFAVWGPYGKRAFEAASDLAQVFVGAVLMTKSSSGPRNLEEWRKCWRVYRTGMLKLVASLAGSLDSLEEGIRVAAASYP